MKILIMHAYSADNSGDGLLVDETIRIAEEAFGPDLHITLLASHPETFAYLNVQTQKTVPSRRGYSIDYLHTLKNINQFDFILGVGGGYLRAGTPLEALKTALVQGPQLLTAANAKPPTVWLPQSIGPARFGAIRPLRRMLRKLDVVMLRDDLSSIELDLPNSVRFPDLAISAIPAGRLPGVEVSPTPVLSIRAVQQKVEPELLHLAASLREYDAYIQSTTHGNDDRPASALLRPRNLIEKGQLLNDGQTRRVVVAVRLHAALMALAAGHYVIHLAYERKGFGAFGDLDLMPWVHPLKKFKAHSVAEQVRAFSDEAYRDAYDNRIRDADEGLAASHSKLSVIMRTLWEGHHSPGSPA